MGTVHTTIYAKRCIFGEIGVESMDELVLVARLNDPVLPESEIIRYNST